MRLDEKIIYLRKKNGWSQEDLALKLDISRQSVSKWESGMSLPELDKIISMSKLFGVSTDYLLKDDIGDTDNKEEPDTQDMQKNETASDEKNEITVDEEEAVSFMDITKKSALKIAFAVFLCIISPITMILLGGISEYKIMNITENIAAAIGLAVLLFLVAIAVLIFIQTGMGLQKYEYLEKENIKASEKAKENAKARRDEFSPAFNKSIIFGVTFIILALIPFLTISIIWEEKEIVSVYALCFFIFAVACAVFAFVRFGMIKSSFDKILEESDYTREKKSAAKKSSPLAGIYWCTITAVYLGLSFLTNRWDMTWVIWPCAGVFFAAVCGIAQAIENKNSKK